jgi:hypothetical protein
LLPAASNAREVTAYGWAGSPAGTSDRTARSRSSCVSRTSNAQLPRGPFVSVRLPAPSYRNVHVAATAVPPPRLGPLPVRAVVDALRHVAVRIHDPDHVPVATAGTTGGRRQRAGDHGERGNARRLDRPTHVATCLGRVARRSRGHPGEQCTVRADRGLRISRSCTNLVRSSDDQRGARGLLSVWDPTLGALRRVAVRVHHSDHVPFATAGTTSGRRQRAGDHARATTRVLPTRRRASGESLGDPGEQCTVRADYGVRISRSCTNLVRSSDDQRGARGLLSVGDPTPGTPACTRSRRARQRASPRSSCPRGDVPRASRSPPLPPGRQQAFQARPRGPHAHPRRLPRQGAAGIGTNSNGLLRVPGVRALPIQLGDKTQDLRTG